MVDQADSVYRKTDAGQDEIRTRARRLDHKLRALLLIVNGERTREALLAQVSGMGVGPEAFDTLLEQGLIAPLAGAGSGGREADDSPTAAHAAQVSRPGNGVAPPAPASPEGENANLFSLYAMRRVEPLADPAAVSPASTPLAGIPRPAGPEAYQQLYHFLTDVIGKHLGLRGYVMQVKVEKAATPAELAGLRDTLHAALQKVKGDITAHAIVEQLDQLVATLGVVPEH